MVGRAKDSSFMHMNEHKYCLKLQRYLNPASHTKQVHVYTLSPHIHIYIFMSVVINYEQEIMYAKLLNMHRIEMNGKFLCCLEYSLIIHIIIK